MVLFFVNDQVIVGGVVSNLCFIGEELEDIDVGYLEVFFFFQEMFDVWDVEWEWVWVVQMFMFQ